MPLTLNASDPAAIEAAARRLAAGSLVGMPTETVYGLAADAGNASAVQRIFEAKGRPSDHPLIVHLPPTAADGWRAAVAPFAREVPDFAVALMQAFWPGPLTLILPRRPEVAAVAAGGQDSVGLRCPSHPAAQALLVAARAHGVHGVAAPSANRFGRISPTSAAHVAGEFGADLWVLDGGDCPVGIESTIVDVSRGAAVLLRPGVLTRGQIEAALGQPLLAPDAQAPRAPGTLAAHYAPTARLRLWPRAALAAALHEPATWPAGLAVYSRRVDAAVAGLRWHRMPDDPAEAAHELFAVLRQLDAEGATEIWVEQPPDDPAWEGVLDRLRRAAAA